MDSSIASVGLSFSMRGPESSWFAAENELIRDAIHRRPMVKVWKKEVVTVGRVDYVWVNCVHGISKIEKSLLFIMTVDMVDFILGFYSDGLNWGVQIRQSAPLLDFNRQIDFAERRNVVVDRV